VDVWVGWWIGVAAAFYICHNVLAFQEVYKLEEEVTTIVEEKLPPFFSWFKLPRIRDPIIYEERPETPPPPVRRRDRTYEVTTTTESFQRTVQPPNVQHGVNY